MLNAISILVTLGVAVAQILIIVLVKNLSNVAVAIRVYTIGFCFIMILSELEWTAKIRELEVLKNWIYRGLSYSFIGLLTLGTFAALAASIRTLFHPQDCILVE